MRKSIPSLTGLRFVAAFCVLAAHAVPKIFPLPDSSHLPATYALIYNLTHTIADEGMTLFFVLSGFVIHYNYSNQIQQERIRGTFNFFVARFARLYPLYLCCIAYELLYKYSYSQVPVSWSAALPYYLSLTQSWFYVPLGHNALIYQFGPMSSIAWSISTEWFFYCVYPVICFGLAQLRRTREKLIAGLVVTIVATIIIISLGSHALSLNANAVTRFGEVADIRTHWQDSFIRWLFYFSPYSRVFEFILGCLCASIYMGQSAQPPSPSEERWGFVLLLAAVAMTGVLHILYFAPALIPMPAPLAHWIVHLRWLNLTFGLGPTMAIIIFCCARYKSLLVRWLSYKSIVLCGEASYSIYLLHMPVILAFRWEAAPLIAPRVLIGDGLRFGMTVLSIIGLSLVIWTLIEVPARRTLRRFMVARRLPELAAARVSGL